ncbi:MAG: FlgD immunoglobulin-like domain containing protein [Candidatus Krumholzibacteriia bacterium]
MRTYPCLLALALPLVLLLAPAGPVGAQTNDLSALGSALTGPPLVLTGDLVMESVGLNEVIRDLSDPVQPTLVGWLDHNQSGFYGDRLHSGGVVVALRTGQPWGFEVISVADPARPEVVASSTGTPYASGWFGDGQLVLANSSYCVFYDLLDPYVPEFNALRVLGDHEGRRWFTALDGRLYGIDRANRVRGFDLAAPSDPRDLGTAALPGTRIAALASGDGVLYAVVADDGADTQTLLVLRPAEPLAFTVTAEVALGPAPAVGRTSLVVDGALLLAGLDDGTVRAFDVTTPDHPLPGFVLPRRADHLALGQDHFYVMSADTLRIYGRAAAGTPVLSASRPVIPTYRTVLGRGPVVLAQVAETPHRVVPVDISNPNQPQSAPACDLGFGDILSFGNDLLITSQNTERFDVWDVADPNQPVQLSSTETPGVLHGRALIDRDRVAFVDLASIGIALYDLSDPAHPVQGTGIHTPYPRAYRDGLLLSGVGSPLRLFDAHDVQRPKLKSRIWLDGSPLSATLGQGLALVTVERLPGEVALHLFDVSDPAAPAELSSVALPGRATALVVHGNRVYAQGYSTTWVVDITSPRSPLVEGDFPTWGQAGRGLAFHGDLTVNSGWLVCLRDAGYVITGAPPAAAAGLVLQPAYPNPFNPSTTIAFDVPRTGRYALRVYDPRGRLIATLLDGELVAGAHTRQWRGVDPAGHPLASGVYLVKLTGNGLDAHRTVTLIK